MAPTTDVIGRNVRRPARRLRHRLTASLLWLACAWLGSCGGDLSYRSVAEFSGAVTLGAGFRKVRIELRNGTLGVDIHDAREVSYAGGVRRAANTADDLTKIEAVALAFTGAADEQDPSTLVIRAPSLPDGVQGVLAFELGIRLPADIDIDLVVAENGHLTVANRSASSSAVTGRGDLRFIGCHGAIKAKTGRGQIIVDDHRGDLDITAAIGSMQVFVREPGQRIRLDTGDGTVQCYIPPNAGFVVDARAAVGRCGSSFGLDVESPTEFSAAMTGARGDAGTKIVLRTGTGHIQLGSKVFD